MTKNPVPSGATAILGRKLEAPESRLVTLAPAMDLGSLGLAATGVVFSELTDSTGWKAIVFHASQAAFETFSSRSFAATLSAGMAPVPAKSLRRTQAR